jgi:hypothetical protein
MLGGPEESESLPGEFSQLSTYQPDSQKAPKIKGRWIEAYGIPLIKGLISIILIGLLLMFCAYIAYAILAGT